MHVIFNRPGYYNTLLCWFSQKESYKSVTTDAQLCCQIADQRHLHITLVLKSLHCLPVCFCIDSEILWLVFSTSWICTSYFVWHVFSGWTWTTSQILWHSLVVVSKVQDKNFWWGSFSFLGSTPLEHSAWGTEGKCWCFQTPLRPGFWLDCWSVFIPFNILFHPSIMHHLLFLLSVLL